MTRLPQQEVEYVDVRPTDHEPTTFYEKWIDQSSAKLANPELIGADALRRMYPGHSLVISSDYRLNLFELPGVTIDSDEAEQEQVSSVLFTPIPNRIGGKVAGSLIDNIILGSYRLAWNESNFVVHIAKYQNGMTTRTVHFILNDGPEQPARNLVLAACLHAEQTHDEIWVFNQGFWSKSKSLWLEVKDSSWDNVVMKEESKKALQKDIYGFFDSEMTYKKLSIPWKRGLIMYGPPGNGKTISIKAILKTCSERGFTPLYVKSFQSFQGEEASMQIVFEKTRQLAPSVLILEDLDSLINDRNRSYFLNQLDGLEGNDGLLVIASTNHFDRLDPGLSSRPSRFDRKYLFDDPDRQERVLYSKYWQEKLKDNDEIPFPDSLVEEVADLTQGFSFAYLKEAFVSALVQITNADNDERVAFSNVLKSQITNLRRELGKQSPVRNIPYLPTPKIRPGRVLDERVLPVTQQSTASHEDKVAQKSRGPRQLPLPMSINISSELDTLDDTVFSLPVARPIVWKRPDNATSRSRPSEKVYATTSIGAQACHGVFHAPPFAYPQAMPGSLPSGGHISSTGSGDVSRRNPFATDKSPFAEIFEDAMQESPLHLHTNRDV